MNNSILRAVQHIVVTALFLLTTSIAMVSANKKQINSIANPDFAFPQTVLANAEAELSKSLKSGDDKTVIQAVIQIVCAKNKISHENASNLALMLDSLAQKSSASTRAIIYSIEAQLFCEIYSYDKWKYDNRNIPTECYPAEPTEWSAELFALKTLDLVNKSLADSAVLASTPLKNYESLLARQSLNEQTYTYCPTLYDLLSHRSINMLNNYTEQRNKIIPFAASNTANRKTTESISNQIKDIYKNLIALHKKSGNNAAMLYLLSTYPGQTIESLSKYYDEYSTDSASTELLIAMSPLLNKDSIAEINKFYQICTKHIATYSSYTRIGLLENILNSLSKVNIKISQSQNVYTSNDAIIANINYENAPDFHLHLYKLNDKYYDYNDTHHRLNNSTLIKTITVNTYGNIPYRDSIKIDFGKLDYGRYFIIPANGPLKKDISPEIIDNYCSCFDVCDMAIVAFKTKDRNGKRIGYVVNTLTGKPIVGAKLKITGHINYSTKKELNSVCDKNGMFFIPNNFNRVELYAISGKDQTHQSLYLYNNNISGNDKIEQNAVILTDLSIYRPGDTIKFATILYSVGKNGKHLLTNKKIKILLNDATNECIDSTTLITDKNGRCNGIFRIPNTGALGDWSISCVDNNTNDIINDNYTSFSVEEYKIPTFFVEIDNQATDYCAGEPLKITGYAKTYSGMPVADANIDFNIKYFNFWKFYSNDINNSSYAGKAVTDKNGHFLIELSTENLQNTPYAIGNYTLNVTATDKAGESQSAQPLFFCMGKSYNIEADIDQRINADNDSIKITVAVKDMLGRKVDKKINYHLYNITDNRIVLSNSTNGDLNLPTTDLTSEQYRLTLDVDSDSTTLKEYPITLWRSTDSIPPCTTSLWVPQQTIIAKPGSKTINIPIGGSYDENYIIASISDCESIIDRRLITLARGMSKITIDAPTADNKINLTLLSFKNGNEINEYNITILPYDYHKELKIDVVSFRDKVTANDKEQWKFKFKLNDINIPDISALATMSDKALNALRQFEWNPIFEKYEAFLFDDIDKNINLWKINNIYSINKAINHKIFNIVYPELETYTGLFNFGYKSIRPHLRNTLMLESEIKESFTASSLNEAMNDTAVRSKTSSLKKDASGSNDDSSSAPFRPTEYPTAFFMPDLSGDENGDVEVSFTMPNFNTTWQFQLFGYNKDLMSTYLKKDIISNKPIMVRCNTPRFVRNNDQIRLTANIFNNSDYLKTIDARIEIFDPTTNETIDYATSHPTIDASGSETVSIMFNSPIDKNFIGFRVYASIDGYSDGEQQLIAILPSGSPVFESTRFYIDDSENEISIQLPKYSNDAQITLQYCDNPIWYCLTALPTMVELKSDNIFSQLSALYGTSIASGLVLRYPQINEALNKISKNAPASPLQQNESLKTLMLKNTLWTNSAEAETIRLEQLYRLTDSVSNRQTITALYENIGRQQQPNGGWSWCPDMRPNLFVTSSVLLHIAMLKDMQFIGFDTPSFIDINKAIEFCDNEIYTEYSNNKKHYDKTSLLSYLYIRSFFDTDKISSTKFNSLKNESLKVIAENWRKLDIYDVATAAILLNREGYNMQARTILESLRQSAVTTKNKGSYFDNLRSGHNGWNRLITTVQVLEAFDEIMPDDSMIDNLRKWLLIERQAQDWGNNIYTAEVIHAILTSGSDKWISENKIAQFYINDKKIEIDSAENLIGEINIPFSAAQASNSVLKIVKSGNHPAWGGVISQYVKAMDKITSVSADDLSIEKNVCIVEEGNHGTKLIKATDFKIGQTVRIQLIINCKRDLEYVAITDERPACMEPIDQLSRYSYQDDVWAYREVRNSQNNFFIDFLSKGTHIITYDCHINQEGTYSIGIATIQSQYAPSITAHSGGNILTTKKSINNDSIR